MADGCSQHGAAAAAGKAEGIDPRGCPWQQLSPHPAPRPLAPARPDPAVYRGTAGPPLRRPHGGHLRAVAATVFAVPPPPPSPGDGQRGGERLSHPSGGGWPGERLHPEPGLVGAAVSVSRAAGAGSGSRRGGESQAEAAAARGADPGGGAGAAGTDGRCGSVGEQSVVRQWAALDGSAAAACQGSGFRAARANCARREGRQGSADDASLGGRRAAERTAAESQTSA